MVVSQVVRRLGFVIGLVAIFQTTNAHAAPQGTLCVPEAFGVPGKSGPPQWLSGANVDPKLDDPRWVGSTLQAYPIHGSSAQAQFRALVKSNVLYVSFHTLVDPAGTGVGQQDWAYLALAQNETSPAKIVGVKMNSSTSSPDVQSGAGVTSAHYFQATSPTSAWTGEAAAWAEDVGVWRDASGAWAINFKVDLNSLGITTTPLRMWAGIVVQVTTGPPGYVTYSWPLGTTGAISAHGATPPPGIAGTPDTITNIDEWGEVHLGGGGACTNGVSLAWNQIGVVSGVNLGHTISTVSNNTFAARPTYNGSATPSSNRLAARFRIANWGSTTGQNWTNLDGYDAVQSNAVGRMERECVQGAAPGSDPPPCPTLGVGQQLHQCVLVTLGPGSNPGPSAITFLNDSVYRNMDFVNSSYFERDAEISIKGLAPLAGSTGVRDVYLYVHTKNMPEKAGGPLDAKALINALQAAESANAPLPPRRDEQRPETAQPSRPVRKEADSAGQKKVETANQEQQTITSAKTAAEFLSDVWPTYEVHVYYDMGRKRAFDEQNVLLELQPGLPFGYYVNHQGGLEGWLHQLAGIDATLEEIAPNFYKVKIPDQGSIKVVTRIEAVEPGRKPTLPQIGSKECPQCPTVPPVDKCTKCTCTCEVVGVKHSAGGLAWAGALALAFMVLRRRRQRGDLTN